MKRKIKYVVPIMLLTIALFSITCYALTESEVRTAVSASSKEKVSGNIFVWFMCAIAFMKVSQKIDSFMSALGISVGRTGGSMMAEAMIVARTVGGMVKNGASGFKKGSGGTQTGGKPAGAGGIFGGIGRKVTGGAVHSATGGSGGGIMASIGKKAYESSVEKGGSFATSVISSVARGEIAKTGTIRGANGKAAMESYFGYNANVNKQSGQSLEAKSSSVSDLRHGGTSTVLNQNDTMSRMGIDVTGGVFDGYDGGAEGIGVSENAENASPDMSMYAMYANGESTVPTFSDIEMGGGRITGFESTPEYPMPREFAMYDAEKYAKPEGAFETVVAVDNSKWYKQYAVPTVEKTPYMDTSGKVQYNEKLVDKMPKAPMRKDRM